jgi:hypothetical protein
MASHILLRIFTPIVYQYSNFFSTSVEILNFLATVVAIIRKMKKKRPDLLQNNFPASKFFTYGHRHKMYTAWAFEHTQIMLAHQKEGQILNDLIKFASLVKSCKLYLSCNGFRSHWIGTACWKLHSLKREKNTEWFSCTILLTLKANSRTPCRAHAVSR